MTMLSFPCIYGLLCGFITEVRTEHITVRLHSGCTQPALWVDTDAIYSYTGRQEGPGTPPGLTQLNNKRHSSYKMVRGLEQKLLPRRKTNGLQIYEKMLHNY